MSESLQKKTLKGTIWSGFERLSVQSVSFIVLIIMARIVTPDDYGLVGMLTVFIEISQSLVDSGFSQALIRKRDRSQLDNSTVFYFNLAVGIILYFVLYLCAPIIAYFYEDERLIMLTRVISVTVVLNSLVVVQRALLTVEIDFKTQAKASLWAAIIGGVVGLAMAYAGFGVWSIVSYQVLNIAINVILLWLYSSWRPSLMYSWDSFRHLFSFGSRLAAAGLLNTLYSNGYLIVIGKVFKASDLGYYTRAHQFGSFLSSNVTGILQRVTYPVLCTIQDEDERLSDAYLKFIRLSAFIVFPLMVCLSVLSEPLILLLLKEQWLFSAKLMSILCFAMMWYPIHSINLNLLQVKGRSDLFLRLEIIKKIIGVIILFISLPFGLEWMCWGQVVNSIVSLAINTHYTGRLIGLGFIRQMRYLMPTVFYSCVMGGFICLVKGLINVGSMQLLVGLISGMLSYLGLAWITNSSDLKLILNLKNQFKK